MHRVLDGDESFLAVELVRRPPLDPAAERRPRVDLRPIERPQHERRLLTIRVPQLRHQRICRARSNDCAMNAVQMDGAGARPRLMDQRRQPRRPVELAAVVRGPLERVERQRRDPRRVNLSTAVATAGCDRYTRSYDTSQRVPSAGRSGPTARHRTTSAETTPDHPAPTSARRPLTTQQPAISRLKRRHLGPNDLQILDLLARNHDLAVDQRLLLRLEQQASRSTMQSS
jgi:hypothetical protein